MMVTVFSVCLYYLFPFYFLSSFIIYIEYLIILAICQGKEKLLSSPISSALTRNWGLKLKPESFEIPAFQFEQMKHYSVFLIVPVI